MSVTLTPELESLIRDRVDSGHFTSANDVVRDALRLVEATEHQRATLRAALAIAEHQIERGQVSEWTPELHADIMRRAKAAANSGAHPKPDVCPQAS